MAEEPCTWSRSMRDGHLTVRPFKLEFDQQVLEVRR